MYKARPQKKTRVQVISPAYLFVFQIYMHSFPDEGKLPHYEMAVDADDDTASAVMLGKQGSGVVARPEKPTELCLGPTRCQTGKTGIVKSSSSFQVSNSILLLRT